MTSKFIKRLVENYRDLVTKFTMDAIYLGLLGLVAGLVLWWWNEYWYVIPLKFKCSKSATKLPPGHMGLPFIGEMISFLWYFKIVRRPDDFINAKRHK